MTEILIFLCILFIFIFYCFFKVYKKIKTVTHMVLYTHYMGILDYNLKKAYEIIHKDRILIYSIEATRITDQEFNIVSQDFARLVIKLIGPTIYKELIELYGDEETFIFNIIEFFNSNYENDEIRKNAMD